MSNSKYPITVAFGDGIGPEIMAATLAILEKAKVPLEIKTVEIGEKVYLKGNTYGIENETWEMIKNSKAFLKAPMTTPQGGGFKSLNVTIRTTLGLYANVRPAISYDPFIKTKHPLMDVVIIRENEEDLYTGIEYKPTENSAHALKIITREGCEKIIHYAFQYAKAAGRKKVTCFTKDNILKISDGFFHKIFDEIAPLYPDIEHEHYIVDIGSAKLADTPEAFDVIVLPNLYGDILSDVAAQIAGSVGLAGSANIGKGTAMFEAIHGSAPRRAGQNSANPSGLILSSVMMLIHLGLVEFATTIHNALLKTIEDGIHTYDIYKPPYSKEKVGTKEFAASVIERLGKKPTILKEVHYKKEITGVAGVPKRKSKTSKIEIVGIDLFLSFNKSKEELLKALTSLNNEGLKLEMITNRGVRIWPSTSTDAFLSDNWRCRFMEEKEARGLSLKEIAHFIKKFEEAGLEFNELHLLKTFDGKKGFSLST